MDTKSNVLETALRLLRDEGAVALRVRRVATEAGCSTMGVYTHFGGKDGLVEALWLDGFRRFGAALDAVPTKGNPAARLRRLADAYRAWALDHPTHYQLMFARSVPEFEPTPEALAEAKGTFGILVHAVVAAQAAGVVPSGDPAELALGMWGLAHGLVMIELAGVAHDETRDDHSRIFRAAVDTMLTGLRTQAAEGKGVRAS